MGMNKIENKKTDKPKKENRLLFDKKTSIFIWAAMASLICSGILIFRTQILPFDNAIVFNSNDSNFFITKKGTYIFLLWNLFLAWIPYLSALALKPIYNKTNSKTILFSILMIWLFFFPNAPYIITDFVHLRQRFNIPIWYDILMLFSFAGTGLVLGLLSLMEVEKFISDHYSKTMGRLIVSLSIPLCGFGIWMGRFQRWNSWDIVSRPDEIIKDIFLHISRPIEQMETMGISIGITIILFMSYGLISILKIPHNPKQVIS